MLKAAYPPTDAHNRYVYVAEQLLASTENFGEKKMEEGKTNVEK